MAMMRKFLVFSSLKSSRFEYSLTFSLERGKISRDFFSVCNFLNFLLLFCQYDAKFLATFPVTRMTRSRKTVAYGRSITFSSTKTWSAAYFSHVAPSAWSIWTRPVNSFGLWINKKFWRFGIVSNPVLLT